MTGGERDLPTVVIVGRPNVGKSSLFNRLVGRRRAITLDTPGVTRDPVASTVVWEGRRLRLVDTGGLGGEDVIDLAERVHQHTVRTIAGSDVVVVVFDVRAGVGPLDRDTVEVAERCGVPVVYVANKADAPEQAQEAVEFCALGIDPPLAVSAEHGRGIDELRARILELLPEAPEGRGTEPETEGEAQTVRVAIVGRPNVGKSSFLNLVAGRELALVDERPGTTRDAVDTLIERAGKQYLLIDTAGMRRPSRVGPGIERLSVARSIAAIRRCEVTVLMIESLEGMTDQDARIARLAWSEGRATVIAVNKCDLLTPERDRAAVRAEIFRRYPNLAPIPVVFLSVVRQEGIEEWFEAVDRAAAAHRIELRTSDVNRVVAAAAERRQPPVVDGRRLRLFYAVQTGRRPPTLTVFVNRIGVPTDYCRFLERCFREAFPLAGSPLRLRFVRRSSHGRRARA
ncbi:MAG: ribosome biogenesis GTPase Der [Candidatus Dadabacteria bacterium]|nr:MAG: ribosome biogenesis GTPase Der [Candidatus Dadabacteria bacterium]